MKPWLYVLTSAKKGPRFFCVLATDHKAAEDLAYEHAMREKLDVVDVKELAEFVGPDCVELKEIEVLA